MSAPFSHHHKSLNLGKSSNPLITFDPCLAEAKEIVQRHRNQAPHTRVKTAFIALAHGDKDIGLLAYYLWRRRKLRT